MTLASFGTLPAAETGGLEEVRPGSRIDRARQPRARDVLRDTAVEFGVCVRPIIMRWRHPVTAETDTIEIDCGSTRSAVCPPCADKARRLRAQQCREGWHLVEEPDLTPNPATDGQRDLVVERAQITDARDLAADAGDLATVEACDQALAEVDADLEAARVRGHLDPQTRPRRVRSTRRRDDVPDLPRRPATRSTLGRTYTDPKSGKTFRPSLFVTLTLPSYGPVRAEDSTPVNPAAYDYRAAARDAIHFGKLLDAWNKNLRRVAGYDVQYFAAIEPQRRGAPHAHYAIRGTLPRSVVKELTAATYVNVWWPSTDTVYYDGTRLPVWDPEAGPVKADGTPAGAYLDPDTSEPLITWAEAVDQTLDDPTAVPLHTMRFGTQVDVKGVLAGSPEAERAIGYLVKYLVKDLGDDLNPGDPGGVQLDDTGRPEPRRFTTPDAKAAHARRADHIDRLVDALRYEPCAPTCANWLRYGVQPKDPKPGMRPGCCRAKAHRPTHLGYGGRRVLVSRKWTGKDLPDHKHDRTAHVLAVLGRANELSATSTTTHRPDRTGVIWEYARPTDPDIQPAQHRLLRRVADKVRRRDEYRRARDGTAAASPVLDPTSKEATDD